MPAARRPVSPSVPPGIRPPIQPLRASIERLTGQLPIVDIRTTVRHEEFDAWIAPGLDAIEAAVSKLLQLSNIAPAAIGRVFLTGGTSFVPAVREMFTTRFGPEEIQSGDKITSIAQYLALHAESG